MLVKVLVSRSALLGFLLISVLPRLWAQGSLIPPGPPGPTMKTLTEIEPRTAVQSLSGVTSTVLYKIDRPGAYYLTGNITGGKGFDGIQITTDSVTLDLNGFSLIGLPGSKRGIYSAGRKVIIRNGTVRDWGNVGGLATQFTRIEGLIVTGNGYTGIDTGQSAIVSDCISQGNQGYGIWAHGGSIVRSCVCQTNKYAGIGLYDIGGQVIQCTIQDNLAHGITQVNGGNWVIADNAISNNAFEGINATNHDLIRGNLICNNGHGTGQNSGAGIYLASGYNRVENNHVAQNVLGIYAGNNPGKENVLLNTSVANTNSNYNGYGGNNTASFGPITTTNAATKPFSNVDIP